MRAFARTLLRQAPRRPSSSFSFTAPHAGARTDRRGADQKKEDVGEVAEAHIISSTSPLTSRMPHGATPASTDANAHFHADMQRRQRPVVAPSVRHRPLKPIVLEDVEDSFALTPTQQCSGQQLWTGTQVLRGNKHLRQANAACVVGGASAIRRIWRAYRIRPSVVYVPNTEADVPAWCLEADLPTVIIRCSPVAVKRQLLSAEYSDGYAAEFPLPVNCVADATTLLTATDATTTDTAASMVDARADRPLHNPFGRHSVKAMLVLVGLRIPSNVGALLRAATEMGYDAAVLVNCVDATQEKVLRASDGTALSPTLRIYETDTTDQACVSLLSSIAAQHHLMPFLAVPSQEVDPAFEVAKRFHVYNINTDAQQATAGGASEAAKTGLQTPPPPHLGAMVVLGSEAQGLRDLHGTWSVPYQLVTLPLPNTMVDSYNVSVAGSVLLHLFRPAAASHFNRLVELSGEAVADLLPRNEEDEGEEKEEEEEEDEQKLKEAAEC